METNLKPKKFAFYGKDKSRPLLKLFLIVSVSLVLMIGGGVWASYRWYNQNLAAVNEQAEPELFEVKSGQTAEAIAVNLENQGLIRSSTAFLLYLSREDLRTDLKTGVYELSASMDAETIANFLAGGKQATRRVTIVPASTIEDVRKVLLDAGYNESDIEEALNSALDHEVRRFAPKDAPLEGYLLPDTYVAGLLQHPGVIIQLAMDELNKTLTDDLVKGIKARGLSVHEAIILGSIIEQEVSDPQVKRTVAQVFLSRLDQGISLGADPTFRYAAQLLGVKESPNVDSPYNTRIYTGLPPGPIGAVSAASLQAIANPTDTDYLFFVAGDDGVTRFSKTQAEHEALARKYCVELCKL